MKNIDPYYWQKGIDTEECNKLVIQHKDYEMIERLIKNKHQRDETDALMDNIACMFDIVESAAASCFYKNISKTIKLWHNILVISLAFSIASFFANSLYLKLAIWVFFTVSLMINFFLGHKVVKGKRSLENGYAYRKAQYIKQFMTDMGYEVSVEGQ